MSDVIVYGGQSAGVLVFAGSVGATAVTAADFAATFGTPEGAFFSLSVRSEGETFVGGTELGEGHRNPVMTDMLRLNNGRPITTIWVKGDAARIDATFTPARAA